MSSTIRFDLHLSVDDYLRYYKGHASRVSVVADDGRRIELPANAFQSFVTQKGVHGYFEVQFDEKNRLQKLILLSN